MIIFIKRAISSSRAPFTLDVLAKIIVAFAALDAKPKRETVNSFIGKSIDRLSLIDADTCLDCLSALSSLGYTMTEKWLNQWSMRVMPALQSLESRPQALHKVILAVEHHHAASASLPSTYLLKAFLGLLSSYLQGRKEIRIVGDLSSHQIVSMTSSLSCLGASHVLQEDAIGFCSLVLSQLDPGDIGPDEILGALSATASLTLDIDTRNGSHSALLSSWLVKASDALSPSVAALGASSSARLLYSIAVISAYVDRESIAHGSSLIESCSKQLLMGREGGAGLLAGGLSLSEAVDATWGLARLSSLQFCKPPIALVAALTSALEGNVSTLDAPGLTRLISGLSSSCLLDYRPSALLALELSRASVSRYSSSSVPTSDLANLVWSFARLKLSLPDSFAASSQRRLQAAMKDMSPPSLAKMMWALASSNFHPSEPQLKAYASRVDSALNGMNLDDLTLSMEAFALFKHRLDHSTVSNAMDLSRPLLLDGKDVKKGATLATLLQSVLWHTHGSSVLTNQWTRSCISALDSQALLTLTPNEACSLLSSLAQLGSFQVKDFDFLTLLSRLPAISDLDAVICKDLLRVSSVFKDSLVADYPTCTSLVKELQLRVYQKLSAFAGSDCAAVLTSLASLASSSLLLPLFEKSSLSSLIGQLAAKSSGSIQSLATQDVAQLISAVSGYRAAMFESSQELTKQLKDDHLDDFLVKACSRIMGDLKDLADLDLVLLMEALSKEAEGAAGLRLRMSKSGEKAQAATLTDNEKLLKGLVRAITVRLGEIMGSEARLTSVEPQVWARFLGAYCKQLKFGSYSLLLLKEEEEEERRRDRGEVSRDDKGSGGPSEPRQVLEVSLTAMRIRMESGALSGWEALSWISVAFASTAAVPTLAWISAMTKSAMKDKSALPDAPSATRLLYSFICWQLDPGRELASRLVDGALTDSPNVDPSLVLLGCSHCSTFRHPMPKETFAGFVTNRLVPSLPTMDPEQLATIATSLASLKDNGPIKAKVADALEQSLEAVSWDRFSSLLIDQIALNLLVASRDRRGQISGRWISTAVDSLRSRTDGAIALKHLSDLEALK